MFKKFLKKKLNQKGLTLVELLAVVVILGIIAAIAVPSIGGIIENSKKDAQVANAQMIVNAAKLADVGGATSATAGTFTLSELVTAGYLEKIPKDPHADGGAAYTGGQVVINKAAAPPTYTITLEGSTQAAKVASLEIDSVTRSTFD